jgi:hypothetical protein
MTKTKIALAAVLFAATSSAAFAASAHRHHQQAPVLQQRDVALPTGGADANDWFTVEQSDRASSPYAGGN